MRRTLGWAVVLLALARCDEIGPAGHTRPAYASRDAWDSPPPEGLTFEPIDAARVAPVVDAHQAEAQASLAAVPARALSAEEAARLSGRALPEGGVYVLIRGVALVEATGSFRVGVHDRAVHVHHGSLGQRHARMTRKAIVAVLSSMPEQVFVSCSMAE